MPVYTLLSAVTATGAGTAVDLPKTSQNDRGLFQVSIADGTATVALQGKVHPDADWVTVAELDDTSDPQAISVATFPHMQANVTAVSGATVSAWLQD